jgi:hypothetical protein
MNISLPPSPVASIFAPLAWRPSHIRWPELALPSFFLPLVQRGCTRPKELDDVVVDAWGKKADYTFLLFSQLNSKAMEKDKGQILYIQAHGFLRGILFIHGKLEQSKRLPMMSIRHIFHTKLKMRLI